MTDAINKSKEQEQEAVLQSLHEQFTKQARQFKEKSDGERATFKARIKELLDEATQEADRELDRYLMRLYGMGLRTFLDALMMLQASERVYYEMKSAGLDEEAVKHLQLVKEQLAYFTSEVAELTDLHSSRHAREMASLRKASDIVRAIGERVSKY